MTCRSTLTGNPLPLLPRELVVGLLRIYGHEKLIEHLSKDIETLTTNLMTFPTRIAFTIYTGPFLILSAVIVASKAEFSINLDNPTELFISVGVAVFCYLGLGFAGATIEQQGWEQCNDWRRAIIMLTDDNRDPQEVEELILYKDIESKIHQGYLVVFFLFVVAALSITYIASQNQSLESKNATQSGKGEVLTPPPHTTGHAGPHPAVPVNQEPEAP